MTASSPDGVLEALLDEVFASTPLFFVKDFLRDHRERASRVRIGSTIKEVRANLRDALLSRRISASEVRDWLYAVGAWGKQHLYLSSAQRRALTLPHLLNTSALRTFLERRNLLRDPTLRSEPTSPEVLGEVRVDDELARITWRYHGIEEERREELDEHRERDDGEFLFKAYRLRPRVSAVRLIVRKTDGIVLTMVDVPLGNDHTAVRGRIDDIARTLLAPVVPTAIHLAPIVSALDQNAIQRSGPRPRRAIELGVAPTQAKYRAEGAEIEFRSTRASAGYSESDPVRHVRRAMQVERFQGTAGKFRLTFGASRQTSKESHHTTHDMIVSLHAFENRVFLFSRMSEPEVLQLVDRLMLVS